MREFFSLDGAFQKYGGFAADVFILSFMWVIFSIPVVTAGAATTAAFYVATRRLADREKYITSDFWQSFKENFVRSSIIWIVILVMVLLVISNMEMATHIEIEGIMGALMFPAQILILIQIVFISIYIFPVTARFDMGMRQALKTSFFMANRHFLTSILCVAVMALLLWASFTIFPPLIFLAPGIYAFVASALLMRVFKRYRPEMDKDPRLEIMEIEKEREEAKRRAQFDSSFTEQDEGYIMEENSNEEEEDF